MQNRCFYDQRIVDANAKASTDPGNYHLSNNLDCQPHLATTGNSGVIMSFDNAGDRADIESSLQICSKSTKCDRFGSGCDNLSQNGANVRDINPYESNSTRTTHPTSNRQQVDRFMDMPIHPRYKFHVGIGENTKQTMRDEFKQKKLRPMDQSGLLPNPSNFNPFYKPCLSE